MKVVYNGCYGGFGLSHDGVMRYAAIKGLSLYAFVDKRLAGEAAMSDRSQRPYDPKTDSGVMCVHYYTTPEPSNDSYWSAYDIDRTDPALVQTVEEMGDRAGSDYSKLRIEDVPTGALWRIDEYDGSERVMTQTDYDWKVAV